MTLRKSKVWRKTSVSEQRCVSTRLAVTLGFCHLHLHQVHFSVRDHDLTRIT